MDDPVGVIVSTTEVSREVAKQFLDISGGDVEAAIELIFESQSSPPQKASSPNPYQNQNLQKNNVPLNYPDSKAKPATNKGIIGFSDVKKNDEDDADRDSFYAGGEKSGIAILDPTKRDDLVKQVFDSAKKHGAVAKHELPPEEKEKFGGTGYTLGDSSAQSKVVAPKPKAPGLKNVVLTFWKDCFTVDDGPPRKFDDPANASFIKDVHAGIVPRELQSIAQGSDLTIELIQKSEDYKPPPKPKVVPFSGSGFSIGTTDTKTPPKSTGKIIAKEIQMDPAQPNTTIQVRLSNGSRLIIKCNLTNTLGEIKAHIEAVCPSNGKTIELRTSYPNKVLEIDDQTVKDAGLANAAIVHFLK